MADSLFKAKQYTQSLELYQSVFNDKKYSPAMLLKMAFINEGLGKVGPTLYFLKLYHLASGDDQALKKVSELAAKYKLTGYDENDSGRVQRWFAKQSLWIELALSLIILTIASVTVVLKKQNQKPWGLVVAMAALIGILFYTNNFYSTASGITTGDRIYLMDGPSAGANVVSVVSEGTLLPLLGQEDVWIRVKWTNQEVYLKEKSVLKVAL